MGDASGERGEPGSPPGCGEDAPATPEISDSQQQDDENESDDDQDDK